MDEATAIEAAECVDAMLVGVVESQLLAALLELGVIDRLADRPDGMPFEELAQHICGGGTSQLLDPALVVDMMRRADVFGGDGRTVHLTPELEAALEHRDLLEVKLELSAMAARDLLDATRLALHDLPGFSRVSATFAYFDYAAALDTSPEAVAAARPWVRYLSALTRYEAPSVLRRLPQGPARRVLDVGGNSGELARALCRSDPDVNVTVVDLPAVIEIARGENRAVGEVGDRIELLAADLRHDPLPKRFDLVVMKSFLHDWDEPAARMLLGAALDALNPGGTLVIAERSRFVPTHHPLPYHQWPALLYATAVPGPDRYRRLLTDLGAEVLDVEDFELDTAWFALTARLGPSLRA